MRKIFLAAVVFTVGWISGLAQDSASVYEGRYRLAVSKVGYDGVGVETILDQWEQADSLDPEMLVGKFNYYFTKAQSSQVVAKDQKRYLGAEPMLTLKDSTGADVYYYQEINYDQEGFAKAMHYLDKAVRNEPRRLDLHFTKVAALMSYEKASPDMALSYLLTMADMDAAQKGGWEYPGYEIDDEFFTRSMQEYCGAFFKIGTPGTYEAFRTLSQRMLVENPKDAVFITNLGTYDFIVLKDYKGALKYYNKALKLAPGDYTALKNCVLLSRQMKNEKLEKKYLKEFVKVAQDQEKMSAEARLKFLEG